VEPGSLETAGFACGTAHRRVMRHLFDFFSGYALRPRGVAIGDRTIRFEISFKFFFAHTSSLPLFMDTVEAKADRVGTFLGRQ
jgi:hypothetical protein